MLAGTMAAVAFYQPMQGPPMHQQQPFYAAAGYTNRPATPTVQGMPGLTIPWTPTAAATAQQQQFHQQMMAPMPQYYGAAAMAPPASPATMDPSMGTLSQQQAPVNRMGEAGSSGAAAAQPPGLQSQSAVFPLALMAQGAFDSSSSSSSALCQSSAVAAAATRASTKADRDRPKAEPKPKSFLPSKPQLPIDPNSVSARQRSTESTVHVEEPTSHLPDLHQQQPDARQHEASDEDLMAQLQALPLYQDFLDLHRELCLRLIKHNLSPTRLEAANALLGSVDADAMALDAEQETAKIPVLPEATL
jgi:hypothetical protein